MPQPQQPTLFELNPPAWELDAQGDEQIATVVFPEVPLGEFDYRVPDAFRPMISLGARLRVPLGKSGRLVVAYCVELKTSSSVRGRLKSVAGIMDEPSLISPEVLKLARWISDYYLCDLGPVLETVVPAGVRSQAGTRSVPFFSLEPALKSQLPAMKLRGKQAAVVSFLEGRSESASMSLLMETVQCSSAPILSLRKKGILRVEQRRIFSTATAERVPDKETIPTLTGDQQLALEQILKALRSGTHATQLLWGVTGSGKTEVYLRAIEEVVRYGRQAIVLVPEISLTPQTRRRFAARLNNVAVLHSHLTPSERHGEWQRIARGEVQVVVGARSAIFAPVKHLGLIILDEEHEGSFKQEIAPRYHARDVAVRRASAAGIPLILGTATPSLESWHRAQNGTYELLTLPHRVENRPLPHVSIIDIRQQYRDRSFQGALSRPLSHSIRQTLGDGDQVILLLNRRGFSTHIQCPACGYVARCSQCDIALTHHREGEKAVCHYCNFQIPAPVRCPECHFAGIRFAGLGTQRLEAELRGEFPQAKCLRMDTDTMQGAGSHEVALDAFRRGEVQILVGTQMIAKGLDFPNVTLVGVVNADVGLHLPDFRAVERTFQLVTQVAGRTGRGDKGGRVIVQTMNPDHFVIQCASRHDYATFASVELPLRKVHGYPPFGESLRLVFRGSVNNDVRAYADHQVQGIRALLENSPNPELVRERIRLLGPGPAPIARLRGKYRYHAIVHGVLDSQESKELWDAIRCKLARMRESGKAPGDIQWMIDVDPISML
jgi:primosomal protein N' (replication factor Y) (superfamily II helicase)